MPSGGAPYPDAVIARLRKPVSPDAYRRVTGAALVLLALIVVTGAAVRLTGSGLGCSDWPSCTDRHFVATTGFHADVEFYNRVITGLVSVVVGLGVLGSHRRSPRRRDLIWLSWGLVGGVAAQIFLGKFVVLSHLNPWLVQGHFLVSMLLVLDAVVLFHRAGRPDGAGVRPTVTPALLAWGRALVAMAAVVIVTGTIVTGSGPHSGDNSDVYKIRRLPLRPHDAARIHGAMVMAFLAATIWVLVQLRRHQVDERLLRRASTLLTVLILQGALGYTQYFTGVPPLLVGLHVFGATVLWAVTLQLLLAMTVPVVDGPPRPAQSSGGTDRTAHVSDGDLVPGR